MAINVNVQYNGGLLPDIIYAVDPMLSASGNLFTYPEEVLYMQPLIPPKRFDIFSPITGGCSEGLGALWFFFKHLNVLTFFLPNRGMLRRSRCVLILL